MAIFQWLSQITRGYCEWLRHPAPVDSWILPWCRTYSTHSMPLFGCVRVFLLNQKILRIGGLKGAKFPDLKPFLGNTNLWVPFS